MPRFEITGPDGARYQVDGPEGATEQDALAQVQKQAAAPPPSVANLPPGASLADVLASPEAVNADVPGAQQTAAAPDFAGGRAALKSTAAELSIPTIADTRRALEPPEGFRTSGLIPFMPAIRETETPGQPMNDIRFDIGGLRPLLQGGLDLLEGSSRMVVQPATDQAPMRGPILSPEATAALSVLPRVTPGLRLGGAPEPIPQRLAAREAPLSPEFHEQVLAPGAVERINTPPLDRPSLTRAPQAPPEPPPATSVNPNVPLRPPAVDRPGTALVPVEAPAPVRPAAAAPVTTPKTAAEAKAVAGAYYDIADQAGGARLPTGFANDLIDTVKRIAPQTEAGRIVAGETEVAKLANRIEALRDKPISLKAAQEIDEGLGGLIDKEFGVKGLSKDGNAIYELQTTFRDMIENAAASADTAAGIEALKHARKAWAQARKMADVERIFTRAETMAHPATGIITGIRTLTSNPKRMRGYTEAEKAELRAAGQRGVLGGALHVFGSRLIPIAAGAAAFPGGGFLGTAAAAATTHAGTAGARAMATRLQNRRLQRAVTTIGEGVPPYPQQRLAPTGPVPQPAAPQRLMLPPPAAPPPPVIPPTPTPVARPAARIPPGWQSVDMSTQTAAAPPATVRSIVQIQREDGVGYNEAFRRQQGEIQALPPPDAPPATTPVPQSTRPLPTGGIEALDPASIGVDAARFQFKSGGNEAGVTERLQDIQKWDPRLAGTALVFRDEAGKNWIADGHQRLALAKRMTEAGQADIRINSFVLDAAKGVTEADARAIAAVKNIAEGTGTSIDAAKVLREAESTGIELPPLPPRSTLVREGQALAKLSPDAFGMAINNVVPTGQAALVGRIISDGPTQTEAMRVLAKAKPENLQQAELMVREVMETGTETLTRQGGLFGAEEVASSVVLERAKIADQALKQLGRDKTTFRTLVDEADRIEGHGENVLDTQSNQSRLTADEQASQFLTRLATRKGPVSDALTAIARRLKSGELNAAAAGREFLGVVRRSVESGMGDGADTGRPIASPEQGSLIPRQRLMPD